MSDESKVRRLAEIFRETGEAHHRAFLETDGEDPEWALWYAEHLHERLAPFLAAPITRSRLVFCLIGADDEHRAGSVLDYPLGHAATESRVPWPEFYARRFLECLGPADEPAKDHLALYYFDGCPFCVRVLRAVDALRDGQVVDFGNSGEANRETILGVSLSGPDTYVADLLEFRYADPDSPVDFPTRMCFDVSFAPVP